MKRFRFQGGEIVRLIHDHENLKAGTCGVLWGVYDTEPPTYEACFVHEAGEEDFMFEAQTVEEVRDESQLAFAHRLKEIRELLSRSR